MTTKNQAFAGLATTILVLAQVPAAPSLAASASRLTKTTAAAIAKRDAQAAAVISGGDKINVSGCHAAGGGVFKCQIELIPVHSNSRCRWTDTIRLVRGKPRISYTSVHCSG